jgi:bacillithiol biosynthesis deacetylase BshB1
MVDLLAIAAHPDDVEQTCGGTLLKMAEAGYRTGVVDLTAGEMGSRGTPNARIEESIAAGSVLKLAHRSNMRFPDTKLVNWVDYRERLATGIRLLRPRTVILPYWEARHPDHYHASEIAFDACFLAGLSKLDPATPPSRPFNVIYSTMYANVTPSFVVDITREFERRMESLFA